LKSPYTGWSRIFYAAGYSYKGLKSTWKHEAAFRQEAILCLLLTPIAIWLGDSLMEIIALIGVLVFVLIVEMLNSAVESTIDRIGEDYHKLSGRAKDQGSAAVFLSFFIATLVWGGFIIDKLFA
jgi:diacylglycerol kinase (ATP)